MNLQDLIDRCFDQAGKLGWQDEPVPITEQVALIHSEVTEAFEAYRNNEPLSWISPEGKPEGLASEYADVIIRICHYSKLLGIDLENELVRKLDFNLTRGYRHGGKKC